MAPVWLTEKEAQDYLKVSRSTLYRWQQDGRLTVYRFGRQRRYRRADLDALAEPIAPEEETDAGRD
jgi:excisionase family DNA binding protein